MKDKENNIIIYCSSINKIGGIETWIYYMCQNLCDYYDITLLFDNAYANQLYRVSEYVNVEHRSSNNTYECNILLLASNWTPVPENIKYNRLIQTIHSDYEYLQKRMGYKFNIPEDAEVISVSPRTQEALKVINNIDSKIIYNILGKKQKTHHILHLVTFSRMTIEKGFERICYLINILKKNNIKFDWKIFSTVTDEQKSMINTPEVMFLEPTLDIYDYLVDADYLVQLSDTEAFCYSVHEALQYGTPVIVTNLPAYKGFVKDKYNGYVLNLDMTNCNDDKIQSIVNHIPNNFTYQDPCTVDDWIKYLKLPGGHSRYVNRDVSIIATQSYFDNVLKREVKIGEKYIVDKIRAYSLTSGHNKSGLVLARYLDESEN